MGARYEVWVCGRLLAGIAGSNPAWGMDVCLSVCSEYCLLSSRGLCVGLITHPESRTECCVSYRMRS